MSVSLIPDVLLDRYAQLTPAWLKKRGITLLLSDLDYTLAPKSVRRPDDELKNWISMLQAEGITMMIVSNNRSGKRVNRFCSELGIRYVGHAGKPSTRGYREAMAVEVEIKYEGYVKKQLSEVARTAKLESKRLPADIDYNKIKGLRLEAVSKLSAVRPQTVGQASRISGVSPADISVLLIYLS